MYASACYTLSSWQIASSMFSPLLVPIDFSSSSTLMINGSALRLSCRVFLCAAASSSDPTPSLNKILPLLSPFLLLSFLPPFFPVSEYDLPPPFQWQDHRFGLLWLAVGWSFVTLAAAVLSLGMVHMARGQGSGSVRTPSVSGYCTEMLPLFLFVKTDNMRYNHQWADITQAGDCKSV